MDNRDRKAEIQDAITSRLKNNDTVNCMFQILLLKESAKNAVEGLLKRNGFPPLLHTVDTIAGCWNLNDNWYELDDVEAVVEYCGVYPVKWTIEDVVLLEKLYYNRDIYINVLWKRENEDGTISYIPNN